MTRKLLSQRVAVTGATGFIGMHLLNGLQAAGASIIAITAAARHPERLDSLPFPVERIVVDDITRIREAIQKANVQYVIHLGAFVSTERTIHSIEETLHQNLPHRST
jgi:nucleoside-diphosphate-sugar epimerase